ncbi:MAG: UDP-N-acetyl glucosamine 2-epimerase [Crocinitomicaceae bacterium]|nr:UDP-N-acetyl glucosamine 2-epimerase [Crocinitomicaceae bacterium]
MLVSDNGGLQKEAFFNQKHCIIARTETEWIELLEHGYAKIIGSSSRDMLETYANYKKSTLDFFTPLYGNGVGDKIHAAMLALLEK